MRKIILTTCAVLIAAGCGRNKAGQDERAPSDLAKISSVQAAQSLDRQIRMIAAMESGEDLSKVSARRTKPFVDMVETGDFPSGVIVIIEGERSVPVVIWDGEKPGFERSELPEETSQFQVSAGGYSVCAVLSESAADPALISAPVEGDTACDW